MAPRETRADRDARRARAAHSEAIARQLTRGRPCIWALNGMSITARGFSVDEQGCLVVAEATARTMGGRRVPLDLPLVIANLPTDPTPHAVLGSLLRSLADTALERPATGGDG